MNEQDKYGVNAIITVVVVSINVLFLLFLYHQQLV